MVEPFRNIDPTRVAVNVAEVQAELPQGAELRVQLLLVLDRGDEEQLVVALDRVVGRFRRWPCSRR